MCIPGVWSPSTASSQQLTICPVFCNLGRLAGVCHSFHLRYYSQAPCLSSYFIQPIFKLMTRKFHVPWAHQWKLWAQNSNSNLRMLVQFLWEDYSVLREQLSNVLDERYFLSFSCVVPDTLSTKEIFIYWMVFKEVSRDHIRDHIYSRDFC